MVQVGTASSKYRMLFTASVFMLSGFIAPIPVMSDPSPVLLSFDVESPEDVPALEQLGIDLPSTYFITGEFVNQYPELVKELSRKGTIGSHSFSHTDLTGLDETEIRKELLLSKILLEEITRQDVIWFRAPFLATDGRVMKVLSELGFRYDASDQERWQRSEEWWAHGEIRQLPISADDRSAVLASDFDLFIREKFSNRDAVEWLVRTYEEKSLNGMPFVILLHPRIIVQYAEALNGFIEHVKRRGGPFLTFDRYVDEMMETTPRHFGLWIDLSQGERSAERMVSEVKRTGITDVYLMARSPEGESYFHDSDEPAVGVESDLFGKLLLLFKRQDIRVHAWIPVGMNRKLAETHPEWAMQNAAGTPSPLWISHSHPEVRKSLLQTVRVLLERYDLDGIHLDYLRYPGLDHDFSPREIALFQEETGIELPEENRIPLLMSSHYVAWTDWRFRRIENIVEEVRAEIEAVREKPGAVLSAAVIAQTATSYRVMEQYGQNIALLSRGLDAVIPMAYFKEDLRNPDWIQNIIFSVRRMAGGRKVHAGLSAYRSPGNWDFSRSEFARSLLAAKQGADGVVVYPYLYLFGRGRPEMNMPEGSAELFRDFVRGTRNGFLNGIASFLGFQLTIEGDRLIKRPAKPSGHSLFRMLIFATFVPGTVGFMMRSKKRNRADILLNAVEEPSGPLPDWQEIETILKSGDVAVGITKHVSFYLRQFGSQKISLYRTCFILDLLDGTEYSREELKHALQIPGWERLGMQYVDEAVENGYIAADTGTYRITGEGVRKLEAAREEGFSRDFWKFIELRMHESLSVSCSYCGAGNITHWFWPTFDCAGCSRVISLRGCNGIALIPGSIPMQSYRSI